uniref:Uncharacterized protein n=1 Tax=Anguilla anguilla TaxID=7936 RepID=A0A0E9XH87_ANGAN
MAHFCRNVFHDLYAYCCLTYVCMLYYMRM